MTSCFLYLFIRDLESIDHKCINPIHRIGLIHLWSINFISSSGVYKLKVLLNSCKQNTTSLSLLAGRAIGGDEMQQHTESPQRLHNLL